MRAIKIVFFSMLLTFWSCEEVITPDLDAAEPKLVIDALLTWQKGTPGNEQQIKLSTTAAYYDPSVPAVSGAAVTVTDSDGNVFSFIEDGVTGVYKCTDFVPVIGMTYSLEVLTSGKIYTSTETLRAAPEISEIVQNNDGGFTGEDIEVRAFFTDNGSSDDYYLFRYRATDVAIPIYEVVEDRFFQGNEIFALYSSEDLDSGDLIEISVFGISQRYYNYMNILTSIAGSNGGSPFQSPPATVRGNIVNAGDPDDFPLGFFAVSEVDLENYNVE